MTLKWGTLKAWTIKSDLARKVAEESTREVLHGPRPPWRR